MASRLAFMQASRTALRSSNSASRRTLLSASNNSAAKTAPLTSNYLNIVNAQPLSTARWFSAGGGLDDSLSKDGPKVTAPPMVYIAGEEMTHYACTLIVDQWIKPYFDTSTWEHYDLSCKARDDSNDQVLKDAVDAGKRIGAIFKEPTITPTAVQVKELGLSKPFGSPNGAMRRGWNGITISRDTIHIDGIELGYKRPVFFERHAVGGEYGAGYNEVGQGTLLTTYLPNDGSPPFVVDKRDLTDSQNAVVVYHNPYDNIEALGHLFFKRCLAADLTPYIVTKKTVFKWQEPFWANMKKVFDEHYKEDFIKAGLMKECNNELQHLISDAATMKLIRWTGGGFGMAAHNYDGDMLTDQIAQVHRSPGFITSNLVGKNDDGTLIKEFEASHGTVSDLWHDHLAGKETSLNPLGMVEAIIGAMDHAANLDAQLNPDDKEKQEVKAKIQNYCTTLRTAMHNTFRYGQGTRDMSGPSGFTTEDFIAKVAWRLDRYLSQQSEEAPPPKLSEPSRRFRKNYDVDLEAVNQMFSKFDVNGDGTIDLEEFTDLLVHLNLAPKKKSSATEKVDEVGSS